MLDISQSVFREFDKADIIYCHWKSNEHLKEGMIGVTDLDILVDYRKKRECETLLGQLRFLKTKAPVGNRYKFVNDWIGMDYDTGEMIHLHVHYKIVTGKQYRKEYDLPWSKLVLDYRVKNEELGVYMTNPNMEILILYARVFLKTKYSEEKNEIIRVPTEYIREIHYLKKVTQDSQIDRYLKLMMKEAGQEFKACLFKESFTINEYNQYKKILLKVLQKDRIESENITFIKHYILKNIVHLKQMLKEKGIPQITKKCPNKKGVIIAFIGTDGAGKSTMTKNIQTWLSWKIEVVQFYLGSGDGHKKPFSYKIYTNVNLPNVFRQFAGAAFYLHMSNYLKQTLKQVNKYCNCGGIAVLDRFPQLQFKGVNDGLKIESKLDTHVFSNRLRNKMIKKEEKNFSEALRVKPDIVFKLNILPEEAIRRKKENTLAEMKQKVAIIDGLSFDGSNVYNIDATKNMNEEILEIKRIIWKELYQRQKL